jgi:hypothetical protein
MCNLNSNRHKIAKINTPLPTPPPPKKRKKKRKEKVVHPTTNKKKKKTIPERTAIHDLKLQEALKK